MENRYFKIILNGCDVQPKKVTKNIRKEFNIPNNHYVFTFVGNICIRKNQVQVVRAFSQIDPALREKIHVLFVGGGDVFGLNNQIRNEGLENHLHICGTIPKEEIHNYYAAANATILTSLSEGFGLSIIEGYSYGLPCLTFSDLAAVKDLYHEKAMLTVKERNDKSLSEGILSMIQKEWVSTFIQDFAQSFSLLEMANKYVSFYSYIISSYQQQ